jgi:hypothetical protein
LFYLFHLFYLGRVDTLPPSNDHIQLAERIQSLQWIFACDDHVGALACFNGAQRVAQTGDFGVALGGGAQGEDRSDIAEFAEIVQLAPHVVVGDKGTAGVRPQAHRDAGGQTGFGTVDNSIKDDFPVITAHFVTVAD